MNNISGNLNFSDMFFVKLSWLKSCVRNLSNYNGCCSIGTDGNLEMKWEGKPFTSFMILLVCTHSLTYT